MNIPGYDVWKISGPDDSDGIGAEEGQTCGRYPEPDEECLADTSPSRAKA